MSLAYDTKTGHLFAVGQSDVSHSLDPYIFLQMFDGMQWNLLIQVR